MRSLSLPTLSRFRKIAWLRHAQTNSHVVDFERQLTDHGEDQARRAGRSYFRGKLEPLYAISVSSPAPRAVRTLELMTSEAHAGEANTQILPCDELYDFTIQPEGSELFARHGYAPLRAYLEDEAAGASARELLDGYCELALPAVDAVLGAALSRSDPHVAATAREATGEGNNNNKETIEETLCIIGHAVYIPSLALGLACNAGLDKDDAGLAPLLDVSTEEASGFLVEMDAGRVTILTTTRAI